MSGKEFAAYASWMDVAAGLEVAALQAERDNMPMCAARTRQIAEDLGYGKGEDMRHILILSEVTEQTVRELRALATEWEAELNGRRHWHVTEWSRDCDGQRTIGYTTKVKPEPMEWNIPTEEGYTRGEATECVKFACQNAPRRSRDHEAEKAGY